MADKMMRIAGRGDDGLAKAVKTDNEGHIQTKLNGSKKLLHRYTNIPIKGETLWGNIPVKRKLQANQIEVVIIASELNREIAFSPIFGVSEPNLKSTVTKPGEYVYYLMGEVDKREESMLINTHGDYLDYIAYSKTTAGDMTVDIFIWEVYSSKANVNGAYIHRELTSTPEHKSIKFNVSNVSYITNDGTGDLLIGLNRLPQTDEWIRIKPGEVVGNIDITMQKLFYKSATGTQPFRVMGVR